MTNDTPRNRDGSAEREGASGLQAFVLSLAGCLLIVAFLAIRDDYLSLGFAILVIVLAWGASRAWPAIPARVSDAIKRNPRAAQLALAIVLLTFPYFLSFNAYWIHVITVVFIFGIIVQGLNIHLGEIGAINVGYAGFFAVGAYTTAILTVDLQMSFWLAIVFSIIGCWIAGLLVGACTIRTTGDYLALVTLAFGLVTLQLITNMGWLTHGPDGIHLPKPTIFGHTLDDPISLGFVTLPNEANFYYLSLLGLCGAVFVARRATNSWIGRTWSATRQDRLGAGCFGVNVPVMQVQSFAFGAAFAGLAGSLYAGELGFIEPREFTIFLSITALCMVILGGMGNWWGVIVGALIMIVIPEKLREFQELRYFVYGLVLLLILIYRPFGLFASPRRKHEQILG